MLTCKKEVFNFVMKEARDEALLLSQNKLN